jgi:hypothetical protein
MSLLTNIGQLIISVCAIAALAIPTGILLLRALGLWHKHVLMLPTALTVGMLVLPLVWSWVGAVSLPAMLILWGILFLLRRPALAIDLTLTRWQMTFLCGMSLLVVVLTALPLIIHGTPANDGRYYRTQATDWAKHLAIVSALGDNLPPPNPFLSAEPMLHYYYFPYVLPAFIHRTLALTSANSLIGAALLIAGAFPFLIYGYGRQVGIKTNGALLAAFLATFVAGLDIIFVLVTGLTAGIWSSDVDFWVKIGDRTLTSILTHFIWTPQHAQGLLAFVLILWTLHLALREEDTLLTRMVAGVGAAIWLAAMAGSSAFLWLATCAALGLFVLWELVRRRWKNMLLMVGVLVLSLVLSLPYLLLVVGRDQAPFYFAISGSGTLAPFAGLFGASPLTNLLDFPLQMVIEFGVTLVAGIVGLWRLRRDVEFRLWTVCLIASLGIILTVRDQPTANNYAARVCTLSWVILAFVSTYDLSLFKNWLARILLGLGVLTVLYTPFALLGEPYLVSADEYEVYQWLNTHLAPNEVYQMGDGMEGNQTYFVERLTGLSDDAYHVAALYSANRENYTFVVAQLDMAYTTTSAAEAAQTFADIGVDYVVVSESLPAQQDVDFEVYFHEVYANPSYTVYQLSP